MEIESNCILKSSALLSNMIRVCFVRKRPGGLIFRGPRRELRQV